MSDNKELLSGPRRRGQPRRAERIRSKRTVIYLDQRMHDRIHKILLENSPRGIKTSLSSFIRRALIKYLNEDDDYWPLAFRHLDNTTMEVKIMHEEMKRLCDVFIHFLSYFFIIWPHIPQEERAERIKHSAAMVEKFVEGFQERLRKGGYLWKFTPEHMQELFVENAADLELEDEAEGSEKGQERGDQTRHPSSNGSKKPKEK